MVLDNKDLPDALRGRKQRCSKNTDKLKGLHQSQQHEDSGSSKLYARGKHRLKYKWYSQHRRCCTSLKYNFIHAAMVQKLQEMNIQLIHTRSGKRE